MRQFSVVGVTLSLGLVLAVSCEESDDGGRSEGTEPGDCDDGADNDGDGAFDCDDDGCMASPVCGGAGSASNGGSDSNSGGSSGGSGMSSDGSGDCVIVAGSYSVFLDETLSVGGCSGLTGSDFTCMVAQDGCSVTTSCVIQTLPVELSGDLESRGGSNAQGYAGSSELMGFPFDYDIEFRCGLSPDCDDYLAAAVVSVNIPSAGASCVYGGDLL